VNKPNRPYLLSARPLSRGARDLAILSILWESVFHSCYDFKSLIRSYLRIHLDLTPEQALA